MIAVKRKAGCGGHGFRFRIVISKVPAGGIIPQIKVNGFPIDPVPESPGIAVSIGGNVVTYRTGFVISFYNFLPPDFQLPLSAALFPITTALDSPPSIRSESAFNKIKSGFLRKCKPHAKFLTKGSV